MNARAWARNLARYRMPSLGRSIVEILITVVPFLALWSSMWAVLDIAYWLSLLLALPAAGFLVRLFMIQHDCGHGAFFRHRVANDWIGRVIGVLTLTPYDFWRRTHAIFSSRNSRTNAQTSMPSLQSVMSSPKRFDKEISGRRT